MRALLSALLPLLLLPAGCGSGAIAAGLAGSKKGGGTTPPVRNPSLTVDRPEGPLFVPPDVVLARTVFVNFVRIASGSRIAVELRGLGATSTQGGSLLLTAEDQGSRIGFLLRSDEIRARISDPTAADVPVQLAVVVDGTDVAPPVPFLLLAQPKAELVPPAGENRVFLSVAGGSQLALRVRGLKATNVADLRLQLAAPDPVTGQFSGALATNLKLADETNTGAKIVTGTTPPLPHPTRVLAAVYDSRAGQSTVVFDVFYRPVTTAVTPRFAAADGGVQVALFGAGLVPYDFTVSPPALDFDRVTLVVARGGRTVTVPPQALRRDQSSLTRLVFTLPPSPDGLPGAADLNLRVQLDAVLAEVAGPSLLRYGFSVPLFGPRGVTLPGPVLAATPVPAAVASGVPHLATIEASGQAGLVRLFTANGAGSWNRSGAPLASAAANDPAGHMPVAIVAGDVDRDAMADLLAVHAGSGMAAAHSIILAQGPPAPPFLRHSTVIGDNAGAARALAADVDLDGLQDLLVLPDPLAAAPAPRLFVARPGGNGDPAFTRVTLPTSRVQDAAYCGDLDADGKQDLALAVGGAAPHVEVLFGDGSGGFALGPSFALVVPGHAATAASRVAGIHASGPPAARALVVVLSGIASSSSSPPAVALLPPGTLPRTWDPPQSANVLAFANNDEPFTASVLRDLDADGIDELVLGAGGRAARPLLLLQRTPAAFRELAGSVEVGAERMFDVRGLAVDVAVPADGRVVTSPVLGLWVQHRAEVDAGSEPRIGTLLVGAGPTLAAPDAGAERPSPILAVAAGDFRGRGPIAGRAGRADDLWLLDQSGLRRLDNDGAGGFAPGPMVAVHPVGGTMAAAVLAASGGGDTLVYLMQDGRLGMLPPGHSTPLTSALDLRQLAPEPIRSRPVGTRSKIAIGDMDGDGNRDLVLLIELADPVAPKESESILVLMRGRASAQAGQLLVHEPDPGLVAPTCHGSSTSLALGEFVRPANSPAWLEAAVAVPFGEATVPQNGNHVRFFRYVPGADPTRDTLLRSFADPALPVLGAGDAPMRLAAADFDLNGTTDLAVASAGDRYLRWFLNSGATSATAPADVDIRAFQPGLGASVPLPAGTPTWIAVFDPTGSGAPGVLVATEDRGQVLDTAILVALGSGEGQVLDTWLLPQSRTGNRLADTTLRGAVLHAALADLDADGHADLALGWESAGAGDRNLRLLLAGSR